MGANFITRQVLRDELAVSDEMISPYIAASPQVRLECLSTFVLVRLRILYGPFRFTSLDSFPGDYSLRHSYNTLATLTHAVIFTHTAHWPRSTCTSCRQGQTTRFPPYEKETIVWVTSLYVSHMLQGIDLGREVMQQVELLARQQPLKATCVALDVMPREQYFTSSIIRMIYEARGRQVPTFALQDW